MISSRATTEAQDSPSTRTRRAPNEPSGLYKSEVGPSKDLRHLCNLHLNLLRCLHHKLPLGLPTKKEEIENVNIASALNRLVFGSTIVLLDRSQPAHRLQ